jgi:hypothetical protein
MNVVTTLEDLGVVWCLWCDRELRVWSENFSAVIIEGNNIGTIPFSKLVHLS